jgi:hypothetical protein
MNAWPMLEKCYNNQDNLKNESGNHYQYLDKKYTCPTCDGPSIHWQDRCATCRALGRYNRAEG